MRGEARTVADAAGAKVRFCIAGSGAAPATPWYCRAMVVAGLFILIGIVWDISWHTVIGRDTFWTPAHMAIYLCGILAGVVSACLILSTTFDRNSPLRESSVAMWGFRGPVGAFLRGFNKVFDKTTNGYLFGVKFFIGRAVIGVA